MLCEKLVILHNKYLIISKTARFLFCCSFDSRVVMSGNLVLSFYLYIFIVCLLIGMFFLTKKIGPSVQNSSKNKSYESGIVNFYGGINSSINVKYYLVAIVFVIFDIEAVFMYPWAVSLRDLGTYGLWVMFVFMAILLVGLFYIYKKKILKWE